MADELTYRKLCELSREEKATNSLVGLPPDFESTASALIATMNELASRSPSVEAKRECENAARMLSTLLRMRRQKIVFRALNEGHKHETSGMTDGDHALFDRACSLFEEEDLRVAKTISGKKIENADADGGNGPLSPPAAAVLANGGESTVASAVAINLKRLRIIKDVKAYRASDGSTVGPFKIGDEIPLAPQEADLLVRGRLAENVD